MKFGSSEVEEENGNPYNDEYIQKLVAQKDERNSIIQMKSRNTLMVPKPNISMDLETDIANGPQTSKENKDEVFDFGFLQ